MTSGEMNIRLKLKAPEWIVNGQGSREVSYSVVTAEVWANVVPVSSSRNTDGSGTALTENKRATFRYQAALESITWDWIAEIAGVEYEITSFADIELRKEFFVLDLSRRKA